MIFLIYLFSEYVYILLINKNKVTLYYILRVTLYYILRVILYYIMKKAQNVNIITARLTLQCCDIIFL